MERQRIVTIDGPAGSGKTTLAKMLSQELGYIHVDTGAMYRSVAYKALDEGVSPEEEKRLTELAESIRISFRPYPGGQRVFIDGTDRTKEIRLPEVEKIVSAVSAVPGVRAALVRIQRKMGEQGGVVMEGRDIGSHVFPNAAHKFFLTASLEARAGRRHAEFQRTGVPSALDSVIREIRMRDSLDSERESAPLVKPEGAVEIDTTDLSIDDVFKRMLHFIFYNPDRSRGPNRKDRIEGEGGL